MTVTKAAQFVGDVRVPSDKSLTHRAMLLAAIADGPSRIFKPLTGEDPMSTLSCIQALGATASFEGDVLTIRPPREWKQPSGPLDCGNSGTTMRLLAGLLAGRDLQCTLIGDASLSKRPMARIVEPLRLMGAEMDGDTPPLRIKGKCPLRAISYASPISSAQVKSCVLLAGLSADGPTTVTEPALSRDHTERMLEALGVQIKREWRGKTHIVTVHPPDRLPGFEMTAPADISSAAFLMVAAALIPEAELCLSEVGLNPTRGGIFEVFDQVGLFYEQTLNDHELGEQIGDVVVKHTPGHQNLRPFTIDAHLIPRLVDEIPVLCVLATQLHGTSIVKDAGELRLKESDRIEKTASGLRAMGAQVETTPDGMTIYGPTPLKGVVIDSEHDHRIGMAFAIAGLIAEGETPIQNSEAIQTSFPGFEATLRRLAGLE